jgi:uncharacterized membrane protein
MMMAEPGDTPLFDGPADTDEGSLATPPTMAPAQDAVSAPLYEPEVDFDASVGFASSDALEARPAPLSAEPEAMSSPALSLTQTPAPEAAPLSITATEDDLFAESSSSPSATPLAEAVAPVVAAAAPQSVAPTPPQPARAIGIGRTPPAPPIPADDRLLWVYTIYALILFAVPTGGVSAIIGVLAVTGRAVRADEPLKSHYIFQQRTLWTAAAVALIGVVLIAVGLGTFILFLLAVWMIFRGAWGVIRLKAGRQIDNPRSWLI